MFKKAGKHCFMDYLLPHSSLHSHYPFYYKSQQIVIQLQPRDEVIYSYKMAGTFSLTANTPLCENTLHFQRALISTNSSFLEFLMLYDYSELVPSILYMTTPEILEMATISFIRFFLTPCPSVRHGSPHSTTVLLPSPQHIPIF